jgi:hypothetical protein
MRMSFKYKVRRYNYEDDEFTDYVNVDKTTIEEVFSNNYDVDDSLKSFRTIAITEDRQQTIVVHYIKRGVCDIYYIPLDSDFYYFKKSTIELATHAVGLFIENKMSDLTLILNKRTEDNNFIRGDFFNKSFEYRVTRAKSLREISWIRYALPLGLAFIILGIIDLRPSSILLFMIGLVLWLPGVIIHYQYYMDNHQLCVTLSKGNNNIIVTTPTFSKTFRKGDNKRYPKG